MLKSTEARNTAHNITARAGQRRAVMSEDWSVCLLDEIHVVEQRRGNGADACGALRRHRAIQLAEPLPDTNVEGLVLAGHMRAHTGVIRVELRGGGGCVLPTSRLRGVDHIPA